jgi:Lar family restriction alleviation protein
MTEKTKSCPFCGTIDVRWYQSEWDFGCVECNNCNARGPTVNGYNQEQTEDESIEKWNIRKDEVERLEAEVDRLSNLAEHLEEESGMWDYGALADELARLKAEPTAEQERKWVLRYLSDRACHLKVDEYFEGSRALERAGRAIESGEHWPKDKGTL